jgi:Uncharacterized protein family UPF0016
MWSDNGRESLKCDWHSATCRLFQHCISTEQRSACQNAYASSQKAVRKPLKTRVILACATMPAARSSLLLFLFFAAAVVAVSTEETFRKLDKDNSGTLDLQEYSQLASRLQMSVDAIVGDSKEPPALAAEADMGNQDAVGYGGPGFWGGFVSGVGMIMATEIGDKTFFIAAIMAMQYPRILVFAGAIAALAVMTVLSAALGFALPNVLPRQYTHYLGAVSAMTSLLIIATSVFALHVARLSITISSSRQPCSSMLHILLTLACYHHHTQLLLHCSCCSCTSASRC